jgi:hypothetical protein
MTVTINLPHNVEQAYVAAAATKGVSIDALVTDVLVSHVPLAEAVQCIVECPELVEEQGVFVLRTGQPIDASVVNDMLDTIRRERDLLVLGSPRSIQR